MISALNFYMPTKLLLGAGTLNKLATISLQLKSVNSYNKGRILKKYGILDRVLRYLSENNIETV